MNLRACYLKHQGTSVLIPGGGAGNEGQCAQWADTVLKEVHGQPYVYTPAALDWWTKFDTFPQLKRNFVKVHAGQPIKTGDFIIYDGRVGSVYGHVDVAASNGTIKNFAAYDSNWGGKRDPKTGFPILHNVQHNDSFNNYIVGYIRKK